MHNLEDPRTHPQGNSRESTHSNSNSMFFRAARNRLISSITGRGNGKSKGSTLTIGSGEDADDESAKYSRYRRRKSGKREGFVSAARRFLLMASSSSVSKQTEVLTLFSAISLTLLCWHLFLRNTVHHHLHHSRNNSNELRTTLEEIGNANNHSRVHFFPIPSTMSPYEKMRYLEMLFQHNRRKVGDNGFLPKYQSEAINAIVKAWADLLDHDIINNVDGGTRWSRPYMLPSIPGEGDDDAANIMYFEEPEDESKKRTKPENQGNLSSIGQNPEDAKNDQFGMGFLQETEKKNYLDVDIETPPVAKTRKGVTMKWQEEWEEIQQSGQVRGPVVDYTDKSKYEYPKLAKELLNEFREGKLPSAHVYPHFQTMRQAMENWHQDEDNFGTIREVLYHFNFSDPLEREAAKVFRDNEVPFKLYDIPEIDAATHKWANDDYLNEGFSTTKALEADESGHILYPSAYGMTHESAHNWFAYVYAKKWQTSRHGLQSTLYNDWDFKTWAQHARYADSVRLSPNKPHFYFDNSVDYVERFAEDKKYMTFISRDLPSFSSAEPNFLCWEPNEAMGIQCRFSERGVTVSNHYDSSRNMIAMITGAKRYILSPPRECSRLGMFRSSHSPIYRHSWLNYGHITRTNESDMSEEERRWLERAGEAQVIDTVIKEGEVLYLPAVWFHYIIGLQKSAQCNVRSGDVEGHPVYGGRKDVGECMDY